MKPWQFIGGFLLVIAIILLFKYAPESADDEKVKELQQELKQSQNRENAYRDTASFYRGVATILSKTMAQRDEERLQVGNTYIHERERITKLSDKDIDPEFNTKIRKFETEVKNETNGKNINY